MGSQEQHGEGSLLLLKDQSQVELSAVTYNMPTTHHFINQFNPVMRPYIQLVKDVRPDGNCGYRVISSQMGFGEEGWRQVRRDMLNELMTHKNLYDGLYWEKDRYMELLQRLDFFEDFIAGVDKWMTLPDMGHIIASCYNVIFISLSSNMCLTFLPLRSVPEPSVSRKSIAIGFVNGNHFVQDGSKGPYTGDGSVDLNGDLVLKHLTGNWRACPFILGTECCERLAYYGIAKNLVTYLSKELHQGNVSAARNVTTWQGTCYLTSVIGAFIADSYWGRYWTIAVFSAIYFIGILSLTLSASVPALKPPPCIGFVCPEPSTAQSAIFFFSLYLIALGTGGIKPCVSTFGADQFDDTDPIERTRKGSFFNWFYFCINIGAFLSGTCLVWIQDNCGWGLGYGIPTLFMALAIGSFFSGSKIYRFQKPGGSPLTRVCQVVVASIKKWNLVVPEDRSLLYELKGSTSAIQGSRKLEHSAQFRFLDKAAIISTLDAKREDFSNPWRLCTITQVEELKILIQMFPIWATTIVFSAVYAQNSSMFLEQGMVLDKSIGSFSIPPASLSSFDVISVLIWVPLYDRLLVPTVRRFTGRERGFSELQRIGIGLFMSILAMISASLVEIKRLQIAEAEGLIHQNVAVPMSIFWQIPQYGLVGAAEVFTAIGQVEFFYEQSPDATRSLCSALALVTVALGSYLSSLILTVVTSITTRGGKPGWIPDNLNEGHIDRFFLLIAGLSCLNLIVFVCCAMRYESKKAS